MDCLPYGGWARGRSGSQNLVFLRHCFLKTKSSSLFSIKWSICRIVVLSPVEKPRKRPSNTPFSPNLIKLNLPKPSPYLSGTSLNDIEFNSFNTTTVQWCQKKKSRRQWWSASVSSPWQACSSRFWGFVCENKLICKNKFGGNGERDEPYNVCDSLIYTGLFRLFSVSSTFLEANNTE